MIVEEVNPQKSKHLVEKQGNHILEAHEMASAVERTTEESPHTNVEGDPMVLKSTQYV